LKRITLWASKGYPLFSQSHTKLITPRTSQNFKLSKNFFRYFSGII
jgi:hypothetical protein